MATAAPGAAQQTFQACYVPEVGAMYLIGLEGLPTACLAPPRRRATGRS